MSIRESKKKFNKDSLPPNLGDYMDLPGHFHSCHHDSTLSFVPPDCCTSFVFGFLLTKEREPMSLISDFNRGFRIEENNELKRKIHIRNRVCVCAQGWGIRTSSRLSVLIYGEAVEIRHNATIMMRILSSRRKKISNMCHLQRSEEGELLQGNDTKSHKETSPKIINTRKSNSSKMNRIIEPHPSQKGNK